jgi:hypothetical protein
MPHPVNFLTISRCAGFGTKAFRPLRPATPMPFPAKPLAVVARNGGFVAVADREHRGADRQKNGQNADLAPLRDQRG